MTEKRTREINGRLLYEKYALYNLSLDDLNREMEWARPEMVTYDPQEITAQVGGCPWDDEKWCVEIFWVDESGEFVEGSDLDTVTHFFEQNHVEEARTERNKDRAVRDWLEMIVKSWTWDRLTPEERTEFLNIVNRESSLKTITGTYRHRWEVIDLIYYAYLVGIGYKPIGWREPETVPAF